MGKLNELYSKLKLGSPTTSEELAAAGVSADLAVHYARAGWLTRLARGVYARPDTPLELHPSLRLRFQRKAEGPFVSEPERAVLELLSGVGVRQPLEEARNLLAATPSLRVAVLQELLARCKQVKTVRLCLSLGRELNLPWAAKLDRKGLPTGSEQRWVGRSKEGLLVLKA